MSWRWAWVVERGGWGVVVMRIMSILWGRGRISMGWGVFWGGGGVGDLHGVVSVDEAEAGVC
jgi:hypothetical protein